MGDWFVTRYGEEIGKDEPLEGSCYLAHDCPFCGQRASDGKLSRSILWIIHSIKESGKALFPCDNCGKFVTFPSEAFKEGLLVTDSDGRVRFTGQSRMKANEIFVENLNEVLLRANKGGPVDLDDIEWDGKGTCPGCGKSNPEEVSQLLECISCHKEFWTNQQSIKRTSETHVCCPKCNSDMIIPPTVWCPKCGQNLRPDKVVQTLVKQANEKPSNYKEEKKMAKKTQCINDNQDFASFFEKVLKEDVELQEIVRTYSSNGKLDYKAFRAMGLSVYEAIVEGKPAEVVWEKYKRDVVHCIWPMGKMTIPELLELQKSLGRVFSKSLQKKRESNIGQSNNSTQMSHSADASQSKPYSKKKEHKRRHWWRFWK